MNRRTVVLLSGGMDSATLLAQLRHEHDTVTAVTVDYGQRHRKEIDSARAIANHYSAALVTLDFSTLAVAFKGNALTDPTIEVPEGHYAADTMKATVVPNRNAILLMAATGVALANGASTVHTAVHAGDHAIYPDCRPEFIDAASETARLGTGGAVTIAAPFVTITKTDICRLGATLKVPYGLTWSCYAGGELHCGRCGTCTERKEAFHDAGATDPTTYED